MSTTTKKPPKQAEPEQPEDPGIAEDDDNEPLLDLETLAPKRPTIKIDGERYELRTMDDLGISDQAKRDREGDEFRKLFEKKSPSKGDSERLAELLDRLFDQVLLAPDEVKGRLSDYQKQQVVVTFTAAPLMARMRKEEEERAKMESEDDSTTES